MRRYVLFGGMIFFVVTLALAGIACAQVADQGQTQPQDNAAGQGDIVGNGHRIQCMDGTCTETYYNVKADQTEVILSQRTYPQSEQQQQQGTTQNNGTQQNNAAGQNDFVGTGHRVQCMDGTCTETTYGVNADQTEVILSQRTYPQSEQQQQQGTTQNNGTQQNNGTRTNAGKNTNEQNGTEQNNGNFGNREHHGIGQLMSGLRDLFQTFFTGLRDLIKDLRSGSITQKEFSDGLQELIKQFSTGLQNLFAGVAGNTNTRNVGQQGENTKQNVADNNTQTNADKKTEQNAANNNTQTNNNAKTQQINPLRILQQAGTTQIGGNTGITRAQQK